MIERLKHWLREWLGVHRVAGYIIELEERVEKLERAGGAKWG